MESICRQQIEAALIMISLFERVENTVGKGENTQIVYGCCFADAFINSLTHYHTMLHFDALKIYSCRKHFEKRRNCLLHVWHLVFILNAR